MKVQFHVKARMELREAFDHYTSISANLAARFSAEFVRIIQLIVDNPKAWRKVGRRVRRRNMHRFPYGVIYQTVESEIQIVAVAHLKRRPDYWKRRL